MILNETQIGKLVIDLQIKTSSLEKGLETAKKKLQEIEQSNKGVENSNKGLDASFIAMSASIVGSLMKIKGVISDCVEEYKAYTQAMSSLQNVSEYTGQSMSDFSQIMNKFSVYITKSDLATTIKNFSLMGMTAEQTEQMIESLTKSAIRNRNANYTVSEAVRVASEGYRQGLSTLSDSAGVTENLSVMLDNYAKSIGKTASQLTEAEKNQAYLNRTMYAAEPFANAMSDYMDTLAGKQGQYSQAMRETQVAYAEALEPVMTEMIEAGTGLLNIINSLISSNPELTVGITTFTVVLGATTIAIMTLKKVIDIFTISTSTATVATKGFTAALASNPIIGIAVIAVSALIGAIVALKSAEEELTETHERLIEEQETYNKIMEGSIEVTDQNIALIKDRKEELDIYIEQLEKINELKSNEPEDAMEQFSNINQLIFAEGYITSTSHKLKKFYDIEKEGIATYEDLQDAVGDCTREIDKYNAKRDITNNIDIQSARNKKSEAAQLVETAKEYQRLFNIYQQNKKGTQEYENAVAELSKAFPEAVSATGILDKEMQAFINETASNAETAWSEAQSTIENKIKGIEETIRLCSPDIDPNGTFRDSLAKKIGVPTDEVIAKLQNLLTLFNVLKDTSSDKVGGVSIPKTTSSKKSSSSYSNKALDNYKKQIEHKKALDQLSLQQEISMYQTALKKYAKIADEKNEIREKIYAINKELAQKEKEILDQQTEDYEAYIQEQKNLYGASYDVAKQTTDYNKIIQMHKKYLNQIMKDERLSLDERKQIYREELQTIRDYEQQKRDLRVESIDNTVSQLTNAITKQLEEMQKKDKEMIDKNLEMVEKWKQARINAINEEYDARIEAINKELEALDKAEQQKTRDEEDEEYERKKNRLEYLVAYEHDATTKANYQKELDKLITEYQKTLDARALEDKKEALNAQKDLLQEEQENMLKIVEDEADKQKETYDKQLEDLEQYYNEQIDMAQQTAEKMLLNVGDNQNKILELLKTYGDKYEITGQSLGEKLAQGINEGIANKIENIIQTIQNTIDNNLNAKINEWTASNYRYEQGSNKPNVTSITINQTNNIEQNPEMPSETYRKLRNIDEALAASLAGV